MTNSFGISAQNMIHSTFFNILERVKLNNDPISWEESSRNKNIDVEQRKEFRRLFLGSETDVYEKLKCFQNMFKLSI